MNPRRARLGETWEIVNRLPYARFLELGGSRQHGAASSVRQTRRANLDAGRGGAPKLSREAATMIGKLAARWRKRQEPEQRSGFSDLLLAGLEAVVAGSAGNVARTSALETAALMYANALAGAKVSGGRGALTPDVLHLTGRQLVRAGEALFVASGLGGRVSLDPATEWEVLDGWRYRSP